MTVVLDAGALVAIDRRDRRVGAMLRVLQLAHTPIRASAGVVGQVWRNGAQEANLARMLAGVAVVDLDLAAAKRVGELLRHSRSSDVIDAHVASLVRSGDSLLTSDPNDLKVLLNARNISANIVHV
jgi:hypothetical protein